MCVIIHSRKKSLLKEKELRQAMKENPAGFFLAALYGGGKRDTLRTMDENKALEFWRKVPDNVEMVMHFRIPSRGMDQTVDNVHGWEEDGILFCHNCTLSELDGMMSRIGWKGTDSEFFFRKIFIPYSRGLGKDAYADGKFHPDLDNLVRFVCGTRNRFCFVMPDGKVLRYGDWTGDAPERKADDGTPGLFASNSSWKVFEPAWQEKGGRGTGRVPGFPGRDARETPAEQEAFEEDICGYGDDYGDYIDYCGYGDRTGKSRETGGKPGEVLVEVVGIDGVLRIALASMVIGNWWDSVRQLKLYGDDQEMAEKFIRENLLPSWVSEEMSATANEGLDLVESGDSGDVEGYAMVFADVAGVHLSKYFAGSAYPPVKANKERVETNVGNLSGELRKFQAFSGVKFNFNAVSGEEFAKCFFVERSKRRHRPYVEELPAEDLIGSPTVPSEHAMDAVTVLLRAVRWMKQGNDLRELDALSAAEDRG